MKLSKLILLSFLLPACGDRTSIQTGEVGKELNNSGLDEDILPPGVFRLTYCGVTACPKLVRLQVNKSTADLKIDSLFLPKSNVDISNVEVGIQFQVKSDEKSINKVFNEVRPEPATDLQSGETNRVLIITADKVYETFLKRKAPDAIVTALREHTVEEVLTNVPEISKNTKEMINKMLEDTPIEVTEIGFPNGIGEVPQEVLQAKRRLFAIEEEKARQIKSLEAELIIEDQRQAVQRKRVENDLANSRHASSTYEEYVMLKTLERFADAAENGTSVGLGAPVVPTSIKKE